MPNRSANARARSARAEATPTSSAWGRARTDSAWIVEMKAEPIIPTPTLFFIVSSAALGYSRRVSSLQDEPRRPANGGRATIAISPSHLDRAALPSAVLAWSLQHRD